MDPIQRGVVEVGYVLVSGVARRRVRMLDEQVVRRVDKRKRQE